MKPRFWLATCIITCCLVILAAGIAMSAPYKIYDQQYAVGYNCYYVGGVFDGACYIGHNAAGGELWADRQTNGTAILKRTPLGPGSVAKGCVPLGDLLFTTGTAGGLYVSKGWEGVPALVATTYGASVKALPECVVTDGTYIYSTDGDGTNGYNKVHKWVIARNGDTVTATEAPGWPVTQGTIGGATDTRFRAICYWNGKIYGANAKVGGPKQIYEIDAATGAVTALLSGSNLIPTGTGDTVYQCARYGDKIFLVATDDKLHTWQLQNGVWTLISSENLGVGDLYGIGIMGDGVNAKYAWITHTSNTTSFWDLYPFTAPCSVADARKAGNNYPVWIQGALVTAVGADGFWIQDKNKPVAMHVLCAADKIPALKSMVDVKGGVGTSATGERTITASSIDASTAAPYTVKPVFMTQKSMKSANGGNGLGNDGLLVTVSGKVIDASQVWSTGVIYIDDGSAVASDSTSGIGLKIFGADDQMPNYSDPGFMNILLGGQPCYAVATGVVRFEKIANGTIIRKLGIASPDGLTITALPTN